VHPAAICVAPHRAQHVVPLREKCKEPARRRRYISLASCGGGDVARNSTSDK
jgi:hypothetical protein